MDGLFEILTKVALQVAFVAFLAGTAEALVEGFVAPIFDRYEKLKPHKFWLFYVGWPIAGVLVFLSNINLFIDFIPDYPIVGQVLTAVIAGRGSNFIHDFFSAKRKAIQFYARDEEQHRALLAWFRSKDGEALE